MKKKIILGLVAVLAVCGCQKAEKEEAVSVQSPEAKVFTATIEDGFDGVETKTSLDNNGNVLWKMGDQVSIFAGSTINEQYQVTDASDGKTAAALNRVTIPSFVAGGEIDHNVAFYPYAAATSIAKSGEGYIISDIELPAVQNYAEESFGNGAFPMTAVTSSTNDYNLKFKNVLGGLKLQLKGTARIVSVSIEGNNNEILCGAAEVTVANGTVPSISLTDATAKAVTLDCGNGVQLNTETATPFIIALPAMTMQGGFTVTVTDTDGATMEIKTTKTQTITRSNLLKMPAVTYEGVGSDPVPEGAVDLGLSVLWATFNLDDFYAWGEIETKDSFDDWSTYKWGNGASGNELKFTKYCTGDKPNYWSGMGDPDGNLRLSLEDDVAHQLLGGKWRMPTEEEWNELIKECDIQWSDGCRFISKKAGYEGKSIFIRAEGYWDHSYFATVGPTGNYWSSSLSKTDPRYAVGVHFNHANSVEVYCATSSYNFRDGGEKIRPVWGDYEESLWVSVTDVSLSESSLSLTVGEQKQLTATVNPHNAMNQAVTWSSSNTSVATVSSTGLVTAKAAGSATITVTTNDGGKTATCTVTVQSQQISHEYVDLGLLSGLKWATCNVGATAPEEYGDYFAWGETEPYYTEGHSQDNPCSNWKYGKTGYKWASYQWCNGSEKTLTKYNTISSYVSVLDNKTTLEPADDAARANWGGSWRMPTDADWTELIDNCTWTWTTQNGVNGRLVTGPNGNSIFLPAAGYRDGTGLLYTGSDGLYWSSSLRTDYPGSAWYVTFYSDYVYRSSGADRYDGLSVRPVSE